MVGNGFTHLCILEINPIVLKLFRQILVDGFPLCFKGQVFIIHREYYLLLSITFDRGFFNSHNCAMLKLLNLLVNILPKIPLLCKMCDILYLQSLHCSKQAVDFCLFLHAPYNGQ